MVSKTRKSWEKFKQDVEGWTTSGVEKESWGKRSANRVGDGKLSRKRYRLTSENSGSKENDEIKGYSSSGDDDHCVCDEQNNKNTSKLSVSSSVIPRTLKKCTKYAKRPVDNVIRKWNIFTRQFDNSFSTHVKEQWEESQSHSCSIEKSDDEIISSDSDVDLVGEFSSEKSAASAIPVSSQQYNTGELDVTCSIIESDIDDFDSDPDERDVKNDEITIYEEPSPSISPNTPTPTPTSPKHEETKKLCPPLDSAKKKKQKYLKAGLAEKLHRLLLREKSEKSFWLHKMRQDTENDDQHNMSASRGEKTLTLQVLSRHLDHSVYVIRCDVIHRDVTCERELSGHVVVLLDRDEWKRLGCKCLPSYLRLHPPWKVFDLPNYSTPILLCITHCEVLNDVNSITLLTSSITTEPRDVLTEQLVRPNPSETMETGDDKTEKTVSVVRVSCDIMDALGHQGLCVVDRVNFVARVQRVYWRPIKRRQTCRLACKSSLTSSILDLLKSSKCSSMSSLCLLVQDSSEFFSEVVLPNDVIFDRIDWQDTLRNIKGRVVSFHGLLLNEHRKRKRRPNLFGMLDFLRNLVVTAEHQDLAEEGKQNVCFTFFMDETSSFSLSTNEEVASYCSPRLLSSDDGEASCPATGRVDFYGKLLYFIYEDDEKFHSRHPHIQLFISPIIQSSGDSWEMFYQVISVCHERGRPVHGCHGSSLSVGQFLFIEDAIPQKDSPKSFITDYFSTIRIVTGCHNVVKNRSEDSDDVWRAIMNTQITDEQYDDWKNIPEIVLPTLDAKSPENSLVNFEGVIVDVDQANAYCWFTCSKCQSDDISEIPDNTLYICNNCGSDTPSPVTNTHLEVYLKSRKSAMIVKAKLLQSTISDLLPVSYTQSDELTEGYDVQCVLNKHVGPTSWHVVEKYSGKDGRKKITFKLDEININTQP